MRSFNNILAIADNSDAENTVFARAANLAVRNSGLLTLVATADSIPIVQPRVSERPSTILRDSEFEEAMVHGERLRLETLAAPLREVGCEVKTKVLGGIPSVAIIREVVRSRHDLVMLNTDAATRLTSAFAWSTCVDLMRKCPCPVWVIKPGRRKPCARVLAAVGRRPADKERNALNVKIIELAASVAQGDQGELITLHTWIIPSLSDFSILFSRGDMDRTVYDFQHEHMAWLDALLEQCSLNNVRHQVHLLEGAAGERIPAVAGKLGVDLIVMGTRCRTGVAGLFIGNTAERVLREVDCAVLTVKPDTFVTPVRVDDFARLATLEEERGGQSSGVLTVSKSSVAANGF